MLNYKVIIPVLNQLKYTKMCLESLLSTGTHLSNIVVINNGSSDETENWLKSSGHRFITNSINLGCGGAWTQGALLSGDAEWIILLNNDVILSENFCEQLISAGNRYGWDVVCPAMVENELNYDFQTYAKSYVIKMGNVIREGRTHGVCFAVKTSVLQEIGYFDTDRRLGGREDTEFFMRCLATGKKIGTTGSAFLHHFGSITQKAMKAEVGVKEFGSRHILYQKLGLGWLRRRLWKLRNKRQIKSFVNTELSAYGHTLHAIRQGDSWTYR